MPRPSISVRQRVTDYIRKAVTSGELAAGERLKETYLAAKFGVSRVPVREALAELCQQGWLTAVGNRGMCVIPVTGEQIMQSYTVCSVLEGYIVATSLPLFTSGDYAVLADLLEEMRQLHNDDSMARVNELDLAFHDLCISLRGEPGLVRVCRDWINQPIHFVAMPCWHKIYDPIDCYTRHKLLYDMFQQGGPTAVESSIRTHYAESARRIDLWLRSHGPEATASVG